MCLAVRRIRTRFVASPTRFRFFLHDSLPRIVLVDENSLRKTSRNERVVEGRGEEGRFRRRSQRCEKLWKTRRDSRFKGKSARRREKRGETRRTHRGETNGMTKAPGPERLEHFLYNHPVRCHRLSLIARISFIFIQLARSSLPLYLPHLFATRYNLPRPFPFHLSQTLPQSAARIRPFHFLLFPPFNAVAKNIFARLSRNSEGGKGRWLLLVSRTAS